MSKQREGYLLIDHRASPGLSPAEAIQAGLDPETVKEGKMLEMGTWTCAHCKTTTRKNVFRVRERATCPKCNFHYICDICALKASMPDYIHASYDKLVDEAFDAATVSPPPKVLTS